MVSTSLISKSCSPCINTLVIVPSAPITIDITVSFMFHSFFNSLARSKYLSLSSIPFNFNLWSAGTVMSTIRQVHFLLLLFLLIITRSSRLAENSWSVCISKSQWSLSVFLQDRFWVLHIPFVRMVKFQFLSKFPMNNLAHPVVPRLIFFLC